MGPPSDPPPSLDVTRGLCEPRVSACDSALKCETKAAKPFSRQWRSLRAMRTSSMCFGHAMISSSIISPGSGASGAFSSCEEVGSDGA
jgi:hypothetical protein